MSGNKQLGLGSVVQLDETGAGTTFQVVGGTSEIGPPGRDFEAVEGAALGDSYTESAQGIENADDFEFTQFWEPGDAGDELIDGLADSGADANWRVDYTSGQSDSFDGFVLTIDPETVQVGEFLTRAVTVRRTTPITRAVTP